MDEALQLPFNVVCHTLGCENAEYTIQVLADAANPYIMCGPCSQLITDIYPAL